MHWAGDSSSCSALVCGSLLALTILSCREREKEKDRRWKGNAAKRIGLFPKIKYWESESYGKKTEARGEEMAALG
jgi:hypothetical protein